MIALPLAISVPFAISLPISVLDMPAGQGCGIIVGGFVQQVVRDR